MKRKIITTADGSTTIHLEKWNEQYHSKHGAIQEALHVFIENGLKLVKDTNISILEIGFGTGLNAFITFLKADELRLKVDYHGVEAYPVDKAELNELNYLTELNASTHQEEFELMHSSAWSKKLDISSNFTLTKVRSDFKDLKYREQFNLVYFDAFGPRVQPELWTKEMFEKMFLVLLPNGILTTYSAKGSVRRAMQEVGFTVKRMPGPPGKREMLVAQKKV